MRTHGSRQTAKPQCWGLAQVLDSQWNGQTRHLSSASWALVPPNSLRYQNVKQPTLSHPFHHSSQPERTNGLEEEWEESVSVCVLVGPGESGGQHTLVEVPQFGQMKIRELLASGACRPMEFPFLTTVDGSREDDISVGKRVKDWGEVAGDTERRERGSFRSLFEAEGCPAPFMFGSRFYCFHCPDMEAVPGYPSQSEHPVGLENGPPDLALLLASSLCHYAERERVEGDHHQRDSEEEEKMALMYEKLRMELPRFFMKNHDYTMYSSDVEFINGLLNAKTRGRMAYQLTLSLWRLLCLCYYAEARLEVLKLTKHMEDGTIKARWRVRGLPFYSLLLRFYRKDKSHLYRSYDAFSTFYIGRDGLIHCHKVEKVMQAQPPVLPRVGSLLAGALVALGVEEHRPALNLLPLLLSSLRQGRN